MEHVPATDGKIADFGGKKLLKIEFNHGDSGNMRFRLANVAKPLGAVSNVCDKGARGHTRNSKEVESVSRWRVRHGRLGRKWPSDAEEGFPEAGVEAVSPEVREAKVVSGPRDPSASEREQHEVTHLSCQPWRDHCVREMSWGDARRSIGAQERPVPTVSMDYCFVGEKRENQFKILVARDRTLGRTLLITAARGS